MNGISGIKLFFRYAYPCTNDERIKGNISAKDEEELNLLFRNNCEPDEEILKRCFFRPIKELERLALDYNMNSIWSPDLVQRFWHFRVCPDGCGVSLVKVNSIIKDDVWTATQIGSVSDTHFFYVINLYKLKLNPQDSVFIHKRIVIEKG